MDGRTMVFVGGAAGSVLGLTGGVIGTYFSVRACRGPRERSVMTRMAALLWLWMASWFALGAVGYILLPPSRQWPLAHLNAPMLLPLLFFIRRVNRRQAEARAEDEAELRALGSGPLN